jgi:predicted enzyme related to lactoylglutathione lyase
MELKPRETVILVEDFDVMIKWYCEVLGFKVTKRFEDGIHYCNLESESGIKLGLALASEMQVELTDRSKNSVVLQFEVDEVKALLKCISEEGGSITGEASFNAKDNFWFGSFADPEGNSFWVVDEHCP